MNEGIIIIIKATPMYWYCYPERFDRCPIGEFTYLRDSDLKQLRRSDFEVLRKCSNAVKVKNRYGFEADIKPIQVRKKS